MPIDTEEAKVWSILLGFDKILPSLRVSVIHFFEVDIIVKSDGDGLSIYDGIDRVGPTRYQLFDTGNNSLISPSRPAAPKSDILNSVFYRVDKLKYSDYIIYADSWSKLKKSSNLKRKESKAALPMFISEASHTTPSHNFSSFFDASTESYKAGRQPEIPYHESFIGTSLKVISLIKGIHDHAKQCSGSIIIRRSNVVLKRLSLQIAVCCSLRKNCTGWDSGTYAWFSTGKIMVQNSSRMIPVPDVLYALACYLTPTTKAHADQFFFSMLLTPPSRNMLNDLVRSFVKPYLVEEKERIVNLRCDELKNLNEGIIINMDVGYTGARKAQCATIMVGSGSRAVFSRTDTDNGAGLKEGLLVAVALNEAIVERKLDVVAVEIDDNAANKKKELQES